MTRDFVPASGWVQTKKEKNPLTVFGSESMGSNAHIHCMQPWGSCMLHALFFLVSGIIAETPQIRHSVSAYPYSHKLIDLPPQHTASVIVGMCTPRSRRCCGDAFIMSCYAMPCKSPLRHESKPHAPFSIHNTLLAKNYTSNLSSSQKKKDGPSARYYSFSRGWPSWDRWCT